MTSNENSISSTLNLASVSKQMSINKLKYLFILVSFVHCSIDIIAQEKSLEFCYQQGLKYEIENLDSALFYFKIVDSIAHTKLDSHKISESAIFLSSYHAVNENNKLSKFYINRALPYSRNTSDSVKLLNTLLSSVNDYDLKTDSLFISTIKLASKDSLVELPSLFSNYANLLHKKGDLGKAAFYYQQATENAYNDYSKFQTYSSILNIFEALGNKSLIKEYLDKAIILADKNNYKTRNKMLALHMAKYLISINDLPAAKSELDKALAYESKLKISGFERSKVITLTQYYNATQEWNLFQKYLDEKQSKFKQLNIQNHPTILLAQARCAYKRNNYLTSEKYLEQVLIEAKNRNLRSITISANALLAKIFTAQGKLRKAIEYTNLSKKQSDEYFHNTQTQNIIYLEAAFNRKQQQRAIVDLNRNNKIQEENLARKNLYLKLGGLAIALFLIFFIILYRLYKKVHQQKKVIAKSLSEKDLLLREIHHRVKNNLQLVSSLLTMQGRSINDETAIQAINEGKSRVRSMALIHQDLYNRENITGISVKDYIEKLIHELFSTYKIPEDKIQLTQEIDNLELDVDTVVPLGLIINELITNSLKYAWPNKENGKLHISLKQQGGQTKLIVKDDGVGYDPLSVKKESFGSTLIYSLTLQLEGQHSVTVYEGTETIIIFNNIKQ